MVSAHIKGLAREVFRLELEETARKPSGASKRLSLRPSSFIHCVVQAAADGMIDNVNRMKEFLDMIIQELLTQKKEMDEAPSSANKDNGNVMVQMIFSRCLSLCFEEEWDRKLAGCAGLDILRRQEVLSGRWLADRQLDYVRGLFFVLRDAPKDTPRSLNDVTTLLKDIIRASNTDDTNANATAKLVDMLVLELPSQKPTVREATKECISILAELKQKTVYELIATVAKERLLEPNSGPIFNKPLRALPFPMQIGNIDAITYLLNLSPSLPDANKPLERMFEETIALADADDASLIGRPGAHATDLSLRALRVACLKLLCAAMNCSELFAKGDGHIRTK